MGFLVADDEMADKYLEIALKYNKLDFFLGGMGMYELNIRDAEGSPVFSPSHVMRAIYREYERDKSIYEKMNDTLLFIFQNRWHASE